MNSSNNKLNKLKEELEELFEKDNKIKKQLDGVEESLDLLRRR